MSIVAKDALLFPEDCLVGGASSEYKHKYEDGWMVARVGGRRKQHVMLP